MSTTQRRRLPSCLAAHALAAFLGMWCSLSAAPRPEPEGLVASPERGWAQWRGPRRDGVSAERGLLPSWPPEGPKLLWKTEDLGRGWSSPIIAGGRLYVTGDVGDDLVVHAFGPDGAPKWRARNGAAWKGQYPGSRACAAYSQGRLYHMNAHGRVACLDAATAKELWAVDALDRFQAENITWAMSECLLVDGPRVIVTPGGAKAMMAALDKRTGATVWASEPIPGDQAGYASPILFRQGGRRLLANCSLRRGFGVDADTGKLLWTVPMESRYGANVATAVWWRGSLFYVSPDGPDGALYRLAVNRQEARATEVWRARLDSLTGGALVVDGRLYASGYRNTTWWHCLDWETGRQLYELRGLMKGAATFADGRLYCLAEDGTAALLRPTESAFEVAGRFPLVPGRRRDAWAHPVVLDGRLYLRYHDTLWCYDVRR